MSKLTAQTLLNTAEQAWLVEKINTAELLTTGEIRVHLEDFSLEDSLNRATEVFKELNMHETRYRNGVLIYISVEQKNFSIIGDLGINHVVDDSFWQNQITLLQADFKEGNYYEGISKVINTIGKVLKQHFPIGDDNNPNELPNEISFS